MLLEMATQVAGERVAFGTAEGGLTYQQLFDRAGGAARRLQEDEVGTVAYVGTATDAFPTAVFAAAWAGVPLAPLNYRLSDEQLTALLARLDRPKVVADPPFVDRLRALGAEVEPTVDWVAAAGATEAADPWAMDPTAVALLLFTSGTTAEPKAAVLRQEHLCSYVLGSVEFAVGRRDGGGAGQRAAVPHRRRVERGLERLLEPSRGAPPAVRPRGLAGHREGRGASPTPWSCPPCWPGSSSTSTGRRPTLPRCAPWPTAGPRCP